MYESEDGVFVLFLRAENNDAGILCRRLCTDVREVQVQRDQDPAVRSTLGGYHGIVSSRQALIGGRVCFEPSAA